MKLYQKIMVSIFAVLTVCGIFFGWFMGTYFENRQISRAAETELHSYETALYTLEKLYAMETEEDASEKNARMIMDSLFSHKMYRDYICLKNGQVFSDSSEYVIRFDQGWLEQGRFEETEYVIEENNGEYLMVIGTRIPWFQENGYLFTVRDLTDIHRDVRDFLGQFAMIWCLLVLAVSLLCAAAVRLVLRPLGKLEQAAEAVSRGDYEIRPDIRRKDETGQLAAAFHTMAGQVKAHVEELTRAGEMQKQLLGSLAHEIRTPMTSILGYSDTLLHVKLGEAERERALTNIYEQAGYLQRLSAKLMELTALHRNEAISMEPCDMRMILDRAVWMMEKQWPNRSFWLLGDGQLTVEGDRDLLLSLFVNLLDNGAKASKPGQEICLELLEEGSVQVQDFGTGIPEEELLKIREPFYTADKSRGKSRGIGLGLAICAQIAGLHGAELLIESQIGRGTTVKVHFSEEKVVYKSFTG